MDRVPKEILSLIASAAATSGPQIELDKVFDGCSLSPYAAVSRDWQLAFEPFAFHTLVLTRNRIDEAEKQVILTQRRLNYVRNIAVPITFLEEKRRDKFCTSTIQALFRISKMAPE
ncbi:unnamed protein product [Fusarium venenatum]|uniref:Uncharacterized protein n=1 Tax=Fusarium venenatum TaxID=56646 RepID=A0A2L2TFC0_9HYPO|nr:uncharacterized protein FVRRES_07543 [Fusarium venenatum]CEI63107.1 unnamed protein product [Fusarium venenatum]